MPPPVQIAYTPLQHPVVGEVGWTGGGYSKEVLPKGWNGNNARSLDCDILVERNVEVVVRDGCRLYYDVYRPATSDDEPVPIIVCWSPFGKSSSGLRVLAHLPWGLGIPQDTLSGLERFEGPDPAEFVPRGYAVVNVDARGSGNSDGDVVIMGQQEGEDGADVIEALAKLPWSTGKVGLAGNSHLAIVQWHIASQNPPSLRAIAPWEACSDLYREQFVRGGTFDSGLFDWIIKQMIRGHGGVEDFHEMYRRSPLTNAYWEDKRVDFSKIRTPALITASYASFVHTMGSIRGYMEIPADVPKWLKINPWQEWYDLWACPDSSDELAAFFDHYLKGLDNGFVEKTPKVRTTVLRYGLEDPYYDIPEEDYPLPRTEYKSLYLTENNRLSVDPAQVKGKMAYDSEKQSQIASFTHTFQETTRLVGMPKAVLFMSCEDSDDMVVYVTIRKLDKEGKTMVALNIPWSAAKAESFEKTDPKDHSNLLFGVGFMGLLRASHRAIDASRSMHPQYPYHPHDKIEKISPGQIVEMEIGIWAMGAEYAAGESLRVDISGGYPLFQEFEGVEHDDKGSQRNKGLHNVHFGPEYPSRLILPFV